MHALVKKSVRFGQQAVDTADGLLDRLTSYRLLLYSLLAFLIWAVFAALIGQVAFEWYQIAGSAVWLTVVCVAVNFACSRLLNVPSNKESDYISALILALILLPAQDLNDYLILAAAGTVAMLSKYVLVYGRRHIFNPAALAAFAVGRLFDYFPAWWVGTKFITPLVFVAGLLIMRKMKRYLMVSAFMAVYLVYIVINFYNLELSGSLGHVIWLGLVSTPVLFFAYIMLIEPSTSPHKLNQMLAYALIVGVLYSVTSLHFAPEEALLIGNIFAFVIAPHRRLALQLVQRRKEAEGIYSYVFAAKDRLKFNAGQYLEWTLPLAKADARGNRRYFTVSSSPTESHLMFTVKEPTQRSSFKTRLGRLKPGDKMLAYQLEGSFVLPKDDAQKIAFIAGGIGVTPFRSITKYLVDSGQKRDIILLYTADNPEEFAFSELFKQASSSGVKTRHIVGRLESATIKTAIPDYKNRVVYISGPYGFVAAMRQALLNMGVPRQKIISDYFPGYG
jgi:ferredoxin-NADP reductase